MINFCWALVLKLHIIIVQLMSRIGFALTTPAMQGAAPEGGGMLPNLLFFKREIVRLGSKMDHMSVNLAIGRREKNIWGYKKLQERQKAYNKNRKINGGLFFFCFFFVSFFFGDSKIFVGAAKKSAGGAKW